jgi:parvulin-like peptidyl-prolyl isomerase
MAKTKAQTVQRPRARRQDTGELWGNRLIVWGIAAGILIVAGIVAFGWYQTQVAPWGKTVLSVGEEEVSLGHLQRRVQHSLDGTSPDLITQEYLSILPEIVLTRMERELKMIQASDELADNITVTQEELDAEVRERAGLTANIDSPRFVAGLERLVEESGLREAEYLQMVKAELLDEKVRNFFRFVAPESELQVNVRWIVLEDEEAANGALERIESGEAFAEVAREVSVDATTAQEGGELGWRPRGTIGLEEIDTFLFEEASPGDVSDVIEGAGRWYIVKLEEKDEDRELTDEQRQQVAEREIQGWLDGLSDELSVERDLTQDDIVKIFEETDLPIG